MTLPQTLTEEHSPKPLPRTTGKKTSKKSKIEDNAFFQWALPDTLDIPRDSLETQIDIYSSTIVLHTLNNGYMYTKQVSATDITKVFLKNMSLSSGLLPPNVLWWKQNSKGEEIAIYVPPHTRLLAVETKVMSAPERYKIPLPGLIFLCTPSQTPYVYAVKKRPEGPESKLYNAPFFNVYSNGGTCAGTNKSPDKVGEIPESFLISFFTLHGDSDKRSKSHPDSLYALWKELDGKKKYPLGDLELFGTIKDIM